MEDRRLELRLVERLTVRQIEEVEHIGVLEGIGRLLEHLAAGGQLEQPGLVPALEQAGEEEGVAGGEAPEWVGRARRQRQIRRNITGLVMFSPGVAEDQFITRLVMNLRRAVGVRLVEEPEVAQVGDREASAVACRQPLGQLLQQSPAVRRPRFPILPDLDDLPSDVPVGEHHLAVDRAHDAVAGPIEDRDQAVEEVVQGGGRRRQVFSLSAGHPHCSIQLSTSAHGPGS